MSGARLAATVRRAATAAWRGSPRSASANGLRVAETAGAAYNITDTLTDEQYTEATRGRRQRADIKNLVTAGADTTAIAKAAGLTATEDTKTRLQSFLDKRNQGASNTVQTVHSIYDFAKYTNTAQMAELREGEQQATKGLNPATKQLLANGGFSSDTGKKAYSTRAGQTEVSPFELAAKRIITNVETLLNSENSATTEESKKRINEAKYGVVLQELKDLGINNLKDSAISNIIDGATEAAKDPSKLQTTINTMVEFLTMKASGQKSHTNSARAATERREMSSSSSSNDNSNNSDHGKSKESRHQRNNDASFAIPSYLALVTLGTVFSFMALDSIAKQSKNTSTQKITDATSSPQAKPEKVTSAETRYQESLIATGIE